MPTGGEATASVFDYDGIGEPYRPGLPCQGAWAWRTEPFHHEG
jgi:hypothetical protein